MSAHMDFTDDDFPITGEYPALPADWDKHTLARAGQDLREATFQVLQPLLPVVNAAVTAVQKRERYLHPFGRLNRLRGRR